MNLIVSTCGTSTLTNLADEDTRKLVSQYANTASIDHVPLDARDPLRRLIDQAGTQLLAADIPATRRASAELNGVLCLAGHRTPLPSSDVHVLLHTDTWLGTATARIVAEKLQTYGVTPQLEKVKSLSTKSRRLFDDGLCNLVEWAATTLPGYQTAKYRVIFNLVGGFKSVQGFMQTLGMFYADEIVYIFETGGELLRIPRLPVDLDAAARQCMTDCAADFRRLDVLGPQPRSSVSAHAIPETLLYGLDDQVELSPWGKLLWSSFKPELYRRLLPPPAPSIRYSRPFENAVRQLPPHRIAIVNERIDDLLRFHESPDRPNPRRLDAKQLKGDPMPPSTHEADAWADADCRRIFFHWESDALVLDRLDKPLH